MAQFIIRSVTLFICVVRDLTPDTWQAWRCHRVSQSGNDRSHTWWKQSAEIWSLIPVITPHTPDLTQTHHSLLLSCNESLLGPLLAARGISINFKYWMMDNRKCWEVLALWFVSTVWGQQSTGDKNNKWCKTSLSKIENFFNGSDCNELFPSVALISSRLPPECLSWQKYKSQVKHSFRDIQSKKVQVHRPGSIQLYSGRHIPIWSQGTKKDVLTSLEFSGCSHVSF